MPYTPRRGYEYGKRIYDLCVAGVGVTLLAPVLLAITLMIRIDSAGPALYRGRRVGLRGRQFDIIKFRTMWVGAERAGTTTAKNDPRVTRVGRFLRRFKLDELPQLFNVLRGDMSLVGPRPEVEEHVREYNEREREILTVLPGITDYSSVRFFDLAESLGEQDPHRVYLTSVRAQKNLLRLEYVHRRSFREDLRILGITAWKLVKVVLGR